MLYNCHVQAVCQKKMMDHISVVAFIIICGAIHACAQTSTTDLTESGQQVLVNTYMKLAQALTTDGVGSIVLFGATICMSRPSNLKLSNTPFMPL